MSRDGFSLISLVHGANVAQDFPGLIFDGEESLDRFGQRFDQGGVRVLFSAGISGI